jgi:hypothetical protein
VAGTRGSGGISLHAMTYFAHSYGYGFRKTLGWLGDDNTTLENLGFNGSQISQITSAYQSGTLSASGYAAIMQGQVGPAQLADFLAANTGITTTQLQSGGNVVAISNVGQELSPNPAPTVAEPFSPLTWLGETTEIAGQQVPNLLIVGVPAFLFWMAGHHKGRHK